MINFLKNALQIFGIVFCRFRLLPRLWCVWLVGVNAACLYFIDHLEAQLVLVVTLLSVVIQTLIYQKIRFTRLLGIVHLSWIPMFAWMASRIEIIENDPILLNWLLILLFTNGVSLIIDLIDISRFIKGEREPHYRWEL